MSEASRYLLDTSVLLRHLVRDHPEYSPAAKRMFESAVKGKVSLEVPFTAISEAIYTLGGVYKRNRAEIGEVITAIITAEGVKHVGPNWLLSAIEEFRSGRASFGDYCIANEARMRGIALASFDRDFERMEGLKCFQPK